jgi:hypothetical protein
MVLLLNLAMGSVRELYGITKKNSTFVSLMANGAQDELKIQE